MTIDYAFIKNGYVENIAVFEEYSEELFNTIKNEMGLDDIVLANENSSIGGTYDGEKFWLPQPYPSWVKNEETNQWEAPIPKPDDRLYEWNEEDLSWELTTPIRPYPSWTFDENSWSWIPPIQMPEDGQHYHWNEEILNWEISLESNI